MTLRIALISEHASPLATLGGVDCGGQNVYVAQLARWLVRLGYEVEVLTRRDAADLPEVVESQGVRVRHINAGPARPVRKESLLPYMEEFTHEVTCLCARHGPYDLVHANFWMSGLPAARLKQEFGTPFVITFHALGRVRRHYQLQDDAFPDVRFSIEDQLIELADAVIAECAQDARDLVTLYAARPEKLITIPCGFDPLEMRSVGKARARESIGIPAQGYVVLQLGRLVPRKGIETVIRGYARFLARRVIDSRLLIVGGDSDAPDPDVTPEIGRLAVISAEENVSERVYFVGRRARHLLNYYYCAADVFVSTPWYEPFGITPVEAMACGTPVIGARVGGIQSTVLDGETGLLIPPQDPDSVAESLDTLYQQPLLRTRMGRQGRARAYSCYTWERVATTISGLYASLLQVPAPEAASVPAAGAILLPTSVGNAVPGGY